VLHNRIIKATLSLLSRSQDIDNSLRREIGMLVRKLPEISDIKLSKFVFRTVQLSRNYGYYDLMLKICELVHSALLPTRDGEGSKFADILQQEERMSAVFEEFVRNFFMMEQRGFKSVGSEVIAWNADAPRSTDAAYLPVMRTDVTLRSQQRIMIIDTKYYAQTLSAHFAGGKVWAEHLYQLYAYLKNARRSDHTTIVEGVLLYPAVEQALDLRYVIDGHPVRVMTIDLTQHWPKIHDQLLGVIGGGTDFRH
jgi:5-methylcytosine-specific restriction enzyme subunit McrC